VPLAAVPVGDTLSATDVFGAEAAGSALSGEERPHPAISVKASRTGPGKFFIETKDR